MTERSFTVIDIGGTTLRSARYRPGTGGIDEIHRVPTQGLALYPSATTAELRERVVAQLLSVAAEATASHASQALAVAFAGPVTAGGTVGAAPTIWGSGTASLPLARLLQERTGVPAYVVNDVTAAVWRYADPRSPQESFCLLTVSSGIGCKVYRSGEVLIDSDGHGGELGHWTCDTSPQAPLCDCGARGHLAALASGRAVERAARRAGRADPAGYVQSMLARHAPDPELLDNHALAAAVRAGDAFALAVLRVGLSPLAAALTSIFTAIGVRRFIVIGGFALAAGPAYAQTLTGEIERLGCFGLPVSEVRQMVVMGESDDDHGLIGAGRLLATRSAGRKEGTPACAP